MSRDNARTIGRSTHDLDLARDDAERLITTIQRGRRPTCYDTAAALTINWSSRHRLDVMLALANMLAHQRTPIRAHASQSTLTRTQRQAQIQAIARLEEDQRWTDDEARHANARYAAGDRTDWAREGARVHTRRRRARTRYAAERRMFAIQGEAS